MAYLKTKALFFTTSPRSPIKMIPEIRLLSEEFSGREWNNESQIDFYNRLTDSDFFERAGSAKDKAFAARDRINRAPKALGFVDLTPTIGLTEAGEALVYGKRPQEVFLRQLLKFQLPSPYHVERNAIAGTFYVHPYLEIMRLIRELEYLTFDELKIFAIQLTDYRRFDDIKAAVIAFRKTKSEHTNSYENLIKDFIQMTVLSIYGDEIRNEDYRTRETPTVSKKEFIAKKHATLRDYADACFRYLRYTGLVSISHSNRTISFHSDKLPEVDYILTTVERDPIFLDNGVGFKAQLFSASEPMLYCDIQENITDTIMRISDYTKRQLDGRTLDELKDLRDEIVQKHRDAVIGEQVEEIRSYSLYSEIIDTYNEIVSGGLFDAPLMLEYNTWRAMTMLNGGEIKGNLKFDDAGQPLSTAAGNMPDIECDYGDFALSVEVTLQSGQRQYEAEGEPVARHYGQLKQRTGKETYCLFIAPNLNPAAIMHFYALNQIENFYYGGKTQIIPLDLSQFINLVDAAYNHPSRPNPQDVRNFLDSTIEQVELAVNESDWSNQIQTCVDAWLGS